MSFIVDDIRFEQFQDMMDYLNQRLAQWNNFEVEKGTDTITIVITKPPLTNELGISIIDETKALDRLG